MASTSAEIDLTGDSPISEPTRLSRPRARADARGARSAGASSSGGVAEAIDLASDSEEGDEKKSATPGSTLAPRPLSGLEPAAMSTSNAFSSASVPAAANAFAALGTSDAFPSASVPAAANASPATSSGDGPAGGSSLGAALAALVDLTGDSQDAADAEEDVEPSAAPAAPAPSSSRAPATPAPSGARGESSGTAACQRGGAAGGAAGASSPLVIDLLFVDVEERGGEPAVIDLDADDTSVARCLQAQLRQSGGADLASLQAARECRRQARRERLRMYADAIDVEAEPDDLLVEQRNEIEALVLQKKPRFIPGAAGPSGCPGAPRAPTQLEVWLNPKSQPGSPLYERFVAAWGKVPNKTVRLVFHGTAEANVGEICRDGLDPGRRAGQAHGAGEYFGGNMDVSISYCKGGRYMLVFAVLLDQSGVTKLVPGAQSGQPGEIVVINKPEHQLPLAVVSLDCPRWTPPAGWLASQAKLHTSADVKPPGMPAHLAGLTGLANFPGLAGIFALGSAAALHAALLALPPSLAAALPPGLMPPPRYPLPASYAPRAKSKKRRR